MNLMMENNGMSDIVERLRAKELLSIEEDGYTHFLAKNPDGDDGADEIERLRAENEKLREALAAERERCAKIAERFLSNNEPVRLTANSIAAAIRESGDE